MRGIPTAIDLFSGAGGLTAGLAQAGYNVIAAVENNALACRAYRMNHKGINLIENDIRSVTIKQIKEAASITGGNLDLLAACPPCQGFSTIRTRNRNAIAQDDRNDLIDDVLRISIALRPKYIMMENVPGLASYGGFVTFVESLRSANYYVEWRILNTVNYRVPQKRRRLVLLASRAKPPSFAQPEESIKTVRDTIGMLRHPLESADSLHNYVVNYSSRVKGIIRQIPRNGGSRSAIRATDRLQCHRRSDGFNDVYGRMAWDKPAPTITGGCINPSKGRFLHPTQNRAITLREASLLQTFPSNYKFPVEAGRYPVATLIGNALPPEFIRRHAYALLQS